MTAAFRFPSAAKLRDVTSKFLAQKIFARNASSAEGDVGLTHRKTLFDTVTKPLKLTALLLRLRLIYQGRMIFPVEDAGTRIGKSTGSR